MYDFLTQNKTIVNLFTNNTKYTKETFAPATEHVFIEYDGHISTPETNIGKILSYLNNPKYKTILFIGPPGSGKTTLINELMKKTAEFPIYCVLLNPTTILSTQNAKNLNMTLQVGKSTPLAKSDINTPLHISAVYDKANVCEEELIRRLSFNPNMNTIIFVDEAHENVAALDYRWDALEKIQSLSDTVLLNNGTSVYITATPHRLLSHSFDLIIEAKPKQGTATPICNQLAIYENTSSVSMKNVLINQILEMVNNNEIPLIRFQDKDGIIDVQKELSRRGIVSESITSEDKEVVEIDDLTSEKGETTYKSIIYDHVANRSQLPRYNHENHKIQVYLCTSVLESGSSLVSINGETDATLTPVYVCSTINDCFIDRIIQFFYRIRYHFNRAVLLIQNTDYNLIVNNALSVISEIEGITVTANLEKPYILIITPDTLKINNISTLLRNSKIYFKMTFENNLHCIIISKKTFISLEDISIDMIDLANNYFTVLDNSFEGFKRIFDSKTCYDKTDYNLEAKTVDGKPNNMKIIKRNGDCLYIDKKVLWKQTYDRFSGQYYYHKEFLYHELSELLHIDYNIHQISSASSYTNGNNVMEHTQIMNAIKQALEDDENIINQILSNNNIQNATLLSVESTKEFLYFTNIVKLIEDTAISYNMLDECYRKKNNISNELAKKAISLLSSREEKKLECLTVIRVPDFIKIKGISSNTIKYELIINSSYWNIIKEALKLEVSIHCICHHIKDSKSLTRINEYLKKVKYINYRKQYSKEDLPTLGIVGMEIYTSLIFAKYNDNGKLIQKDITEAHLVQLKNALNQNLNRMTRHVYNVTDAKNLITRIYHCRALGNGKFRIEYLANAAA